MGYHMVFNFYPYFPDFVLENIVAVGRSSQNLGKSRASAPTVGWHSRVRGCLTAEVPTFLVVLFSCSQCH